MERHVHLEFRSKSRVVGDFSVHTRKCTYTVCLDRTILSQVQTAALSLTKSMCVLVRDSFSTGTFKHTHTHTHHSIFQAHFDNGSERSGGPKVRYFLVDTWRGYRLCFVGTNRSLAFVFLRTNMVES